MQAQTQAKTLVVFDLETTELITRGNDPRSLRPSLLCAQKLDLVKTAQTGEPSVLEEMEVWCGNGDPLDMFFTWLDQATVVVAHNGLRFDMPVLRMQYEGKDNGLRYVKHCAKVFDTLHVLRKSNPDQGRLALGRLLSLNGDNKLGDGKQAPAMWHDKKRHSDLLRYCWQDVKGLAKLVAKPFINLEYGVTSAISAKRLMNAFAPPYTRGTEFMEQGTDEWHRAREGKITASTASTFLGIKRYHSSADPNAKSMMDFGLEMEPIIRSLYANNTGKLVRKTGFYTHEEYSFIGASPDGIVEYGPQNHTYEITKSAVLVEIKIGIKEKPELTDAHLVQGILQIACTGANCVDFVLANSYTLKFDVVRLERDKDTERVIIGRCLKEKEMRDSDGDVQMREEDGDVDDELQELQNALDNTRKEFLFDVTNHEPSFGSHEAPLLYTQYTEHR
tara:strand:- start:346 stop:1686 length:1341 start_codon:yes stop_codon:yes gene_type:complete